MLLACLHRRRTSHQILLLAWTFCWVTLSESTMEKSVQIAVIKVLIGLSIFMNILNMGCCEDGSGTPLSNQPLSPFNQPLDAQPLTPFNGQPLANQLPASPLIGQQFPLVNQPLINQPGFVNQPFSPLNAQPGFSQPLANVQPGLNQLTTLGQPFANSLAFNGSDNPCISTQVVVMAIFLMMVVLSFLSLSMWSLRCSIYQIITYSPPYIFPYFRPDLLA